MEAHLSGQVALVINAIATDEDGGCVGSVLKRSNLSVQQSAGACLVRPGISTAKESEQATGANRRPLK